LELTKMVGIGGVSGAVVVDLKNFQQFSMDNTTWIATMGAGTLLADVTSRMLAAGNRAIAHGTCPQVGIGGHATIGGLGPASRMWGAALDHVVEATVVLANGTIATASDTQNQDIFFALKGAAASFGVITQFKFRTHEAPGEAIAYTYDFTAGTTAEKAQAFKNWQTLISNPALSRKFASQVIILELGMMITGTYFGSQAEYDALNVTAMFPKAGSHNTVVFNDWLGLVGHWAEDEALQIAGGIPSAFCSNSLTQQTRAL
jgi:FAD/FMN-containing dehydrogenase